VSVWDLRKKGNPMKNFTLGFPEVPSHFQSTNMISSTLQYWKVPIFLMDQQKIK